MAGGGTVKWEGHWLKDSEKLICTLSGFCISLTMILVFFFLKFAFISSSFKNKIEKGNLDVSSNNGRSSVHVSDCRI